MSKHIKFWCNFFLGLTFLDFFDDVGITSPYAQDGFPKSSNSNIMRPPRTGMHTNSSASTSSHQNKSIYRGIDVTIRKPTNVTTTFCFARMWLWYARLPLGIENSSPKLRWKSFVDPHTKNQERWLRSFKPVYHAIHVSITTWKLVMADPHTKATFLIE